jgi:NAD(P)-dependent dehydrogenase (short-subunit alcohol dehydrogenase family)
VRRRNGELWVTAPAGIVVLHDGQPERIIPASVLQGAFVRAMAEDDNGVVWVASGSGIFRFSSNHWEKLGKKAGLPTVRFESVVAGRDGAVWVATGDSVYSLSVGEGRRATAQKVVDAAVQKFGSIDAVVNNAGIFSAKPFIDYSADDFRALVSTNLEGSRACAPIRWAQAAGCDWGEMAR